jgi:hypothetical protein
MKAKSFIVGGLLSIIPAGFIILHLLDLYDVYFGNGDYPFGSEFYTKYSIYSSKTIYVLFSILTIFILSCIIYFAFRQKWNLFFIMLVLGILMTIYPLVEA